MRASSIVGQQEALLVEECQHDLQVTSDVCEEISNDLKALTNAVSELAWAMKSVRDTYQGIAQKAQDCGLLVAGDTVSLVDESDDYLVSSFNELQAQAGVQRLNYERAEYVFSLALDGLKVDTYEQWIEPVFTALKEQFILDNKHPIAKAIPYGVGLLDMSGQMTIGASMWHFNGLYEPPKGFFAKGVLSQWTLPTDWKTRDRTIWYANSSPVRRKGRGGRRRGGSGRRWRYHRLRHVPNRHLSAPRMERGT